MLFFLHWHPQNFTLLNVWLLIGECEFERRSMSAQENLNHISSFLDSACWADLSSFWLVKMSAILIIAFSQNNKKEK